MKQGRDARMENEELKRRFAQEGLDILQVWQPTPDDLTLENRRLSSLLDWVGAYRACPNRGQLEARGFLFPPIDPDCDPDSDWLLFERWMGGKPLRWTFAQEFGAPRDEVEMADEELTAEYARICALLAERGVEIGYCTDVPLRMRYAHLCAELMGAEFEFVTPGTVCRLDGCTGECDACFQRRWCELLEEDLPDENDGRACALAALRALCA